MHNKCIDVILHDQCYIGDNYRKPMNSNSDEQINELKNDIHKLRSENEHLRDFVNINF